MDTKLFTMDKNNYGTAYKNHLFEQYKIYIDSIEKISDRRQNANNFFIAINTTLITLLGLSLQLEILNSFTWAKAFLALIGMIICIIFWYLLRSYKQLNSGKFKVLHEIEKRLPLNLYNYEWDILGQGENSKLYYPFSHIELYIPWVFGLVYLIIFIIFLNI